MMEGGDCLESVVLSGESIEEFEHKLECITLRSCVDLLIPSLYPPCILIKHLHTLLINIGVMKGSANEGSKDYEIEKMLVKEMSIILIQQINITDNIIPDKNRRRNSSPRRIMSFEPTGDEEVRVSDICNILSYSRYNTRDNNSLNKGLLVGKERLIEALSLLMTTSSTLERMKNIELRYYGNSDDDDITIQQQEAKKRDIHGTSHAIQVIRSSSGRRRGNRSFASSSSSPSTIALTSSALLGGDDSSTPGKGYPSPTTRRRKVGMRKKKKRLSDLLSMGGGDDDSSSSGMGGGGGGGGGGMQYEKLNDDEEDGRTERISSDHHISSSLQPPLAPPFDQRAPRRFIPSSTSDGGYARHDDEVRTLSVSPRRMRMTPSPYNRRRSETHGGEEDINRNSIAEEISPVSFGGSDWITSLSTTRRNTITPQHLSSRPSRHLMLYQRGMQSRQDRLNKLKKHKEDQDVKELAPCTFKPRTRTSSTSITSTKKGQVVDAPRTEVKDINPRGYSEAVNRLQRGYRERHLMREVVENRDPDGTVMQQLIKNQKSASDTSNIIESTPAPRRESSRSLQALRGKGSIGRRGRGRAMRRAPPDGDAPATSISPPTTERNNRRNPPRISSDCCKMGRSSTPNSGRFNIKRDSPYTRLPSITKRNSHYSRGGGGRMDGEWIEVEVTRNSETVGRSGRERRYVVGKLLIQEGQPPRAIHEAVMAFSQKHRLKTAETLELHKALKHKLDTKDYDDLLIPSEDDDNNTNDHPVENNNTTKRVVKSPTSPSPVVSPELCPPATPIAPSTASSRPPRCSMSHNKGNSVLEERRDMNDCCELSFGSSSSIED